MVALRGGSYTRSINMTMQGVKRVDTDELYDRQSTARRCATYRQADVPLLPPMVPRLSGS